MGLLCAGCVMAVSFASPYKGSGRGFIYTTSSSHSTASSAGLAQAPVASMGSVSRGVSAGVSSRGVAPVRTMAVAMPAVSPVHGIYTAASAVSGGVTTYDKAPKKPRGGVRKSSTPTYPLNPESPGYCEHCYYVWVDDDSYEATGGYWACSECGRELEDGCNCGTCNCVPIDLNWGAMLFLALLAGGYGVRASMREKCTMKENENRA